MNDNSNDSCTKVSHRKSRTSSWSSNKFSDLLLESTKEDVLEDLSVLRREMGQRRPSTDHLRINSLNGDDFKSKSVPTSPICRALKVDPNLPTTALTALSPIMIPHSSPVTSMIQECLSFVGDTQFSAIISQSVEKFIIETFHQSISKYPTSDFDHLFPDNIKLSGRNLPLPPSPYHSPAYKNSPKHDLLAHSFSAPSTPMATTADRPLCPAGCPSAPCVLPNMPVDSLQQHPLWWDFKKSNKPAMDSSLQLQVASFLSSCSVPFFAHHSVDTMLEIAKMVQSVSVLSGESIIKQGHQGRCMFFVVSGSLNVHVDASDGSEKRRSLTVGDWFGELATFSSNGTRTASVVCETDAEVLQLNRYDYERTVRWEFEAVISDAVRFCRSTLFFQNWQRSRLLALAACMRPLCLPKGTVVIKEHDAADHAYWIDEGTVSVHMSIDGHDTDITTLGPGELFGEAGALTGLCRAATIVAQSDIKVWIVSREDFVNMITKDALIQVNAILEQRREFNRRLIGKSNV